MEMSVREARAQFAAALEAASRGERVTITKNGKPVAELGPPKCRAPGFDWATLDQIRAQEGLDQVRLREGWDERFDDPAFSRAALGLGDDWESGPA